MIYNKFTPIVGAAFPVRVPTDFVGLHFFGYPQKASAVGWTNVPAQAALSYSVSWPFDWQGGPPGAISWALTEKTQGVYTWTDMDAYVAGQAALGKVITYYMHHIPSFYSANPTLAQSGPSGDGSGGPLTLSGRAGLAAFLTALITRYKGKGTPIKYLSTWEEPNQFAGPYNGTTITNAGTWWGSQGDLVDFSYITYATCKALDSSIVVYSPSTADNNAGPDKWIGFAGTVNTSVYGYQAYDVYTIDPFGYGPTAFNWGADLSQNQYSHDINLINGSQSFSTLVASCRAKMGAHVAPIAFVSCGYTGTWGAPAITALFRGKPALFRKQYIARSMLEAAALGVTQMTWYGADSDYTLGVPTGQPVGTAPSNNSDFSGDFLSDANGVIAGLNEFAANVVGKTITWCGYSNDGLMTATFSDGSSYTI